MRAVAIIFTNSKAEEHWKSLVFMPLEFESIAVKSVHNIGKLGV